MRLFDRVPCSRRRLLHRASTATRGFPAINGIVFEQCQVVETLWESIFSFWSKGTLLRIQRATWDICSEKRSQPAQTPGSERPVRAEQAAEAAAVTERLLVVCTNENPEIFSRGRKEQWYLFM